MNTSPGIPYSQIPTLGLLLIKAAISRKPGLKETMPLARIERSITGVSIQPDALAAFNNICGFKDSGHIPLPYYYALAQRIQLTLLTDPAFPLGIPGLVHIENTFTQYAEASANDVFDLRCHVEGDTGTPAGRMIEIVTGFFINENRALECRSRFLHRNRGHSSGKNHKLPEPFLEGDKKTIFLPANAGRRYAKVSGDYNPIHLHTLTARAFGFRRPIAHGIYMLALINAALEESLSFSIKELSVEYKRPVYLPSQVDLIHSFSEGDGLCRFEVRSGADEQMQMKGYFSSGHK